MDPESQGSGFGNFGFRARLTSGMTGEDNGTNFETRTREPSFDLNLLSGCYDYLRFRKMKSPPSWPARGILEY